MNKFKFLIVLLIVSAVLSACTVASDISLNKNTPAETPAAESESPVIIPLPPVTPSEPPSKPPSSTPAPDPIGDRISRMSDRELIGQMVMIGFDGTDDMDAARIQLMQDYDIGNVFLFGWNTDTFNQTKKLIQKIQTYNTGDIPLLIGIDLEGGKTIVRFKKDRWKPPLLSAQALGKRDDPKQVYKEYYQIGAKLKEVGINIDFAPVLDIARKPSATFLNSRMFGSDPKVVSALISKAIEGLHDAGVASLGKHFPGHGDSAVDPHKLIPVINAKPDEMESYYYKPFQAAIEGGVDAMMIAHVLYPNIDPQNLATVSPVFITDNLKKNMGFNGVIFSDDLRMQGFISQYPIGEGAVKYILAGGDIALVGKFPDMQKEVCDSLYNAVLDGTISRERLEESVRHIFELKQKYCGFVP